MGCECERDNLAVAFFVNCRFNVMGKHEGNIFASFRKVCLSLECPNK